jgi:enoyl-CoA hydratase/carnithine racemase
MACDIRIARRDGGKIGLPEVALGVLPGTGGTQRLARLVGKARAIELIATGRTFSFDEALEIGLVTKIVDDADFMKAALEYARQFLPPNKAAKAVGHIKRSIQSGVEMDLADGLALEQELQSQLFRSEDAREGLDSWVDKRVPRFKGK